MSATTSNAPIAQRFLSGHWLERYVLLTLLEALALNEVLLNPQVILPNGDDFELDVFAIDSLGDPVWIEAKTGDYQVHVQKYSRLVPILGVPPKRAILVHPDIDGQQGEFLSGAYGMTVVNLSGWQKLLPAIRGT